MSASSAIHHSSPQSGTVGILGEHLDHFINKMERMDLEKSLRGQTIAEQIQGQSGDHSSSNAHEVMSAYEVMSQNNYQALYQNIQHALQESLFELHKLSETAIQAFQGFSSEFQNQNSWQLHVWCQQHLSDLQFGQILDTLSPNHSENKTSNHDDLLATMTEGEQARLYQHLDTAHKARQQQQKKEVLQLIKSLKKQGISQKKIADKLNEMGFHTTNGQGTWTRSKISYLLAQK